MARSALLLLLLAAALRGATAATTCGSSALSIVTCPGDCLTPDALYDAATGRLHVVFGTSTKHAMYIVSTDDGATFSAPQQLDTPPGVTTTMGERGPKITLAADGTLVVVWADFWSGPGARVYGRAVSSTDGGKTWSAPVQVTPPELFGIDGFSVAAGADAAGRPQIVALYHVNNTQPPNASSATWLYTQYSGDGGRTWSPAAVVTPLGLPAVACSMCMTRPRNLNGGQVALAFRSAVANVRDFYVLNGSASGSQFTATRVNADGWVQTECPMNGPELSVSGGSGSGELLITAFMTNNASNVYWSAAAGVGKPFVGHYPTPLHERNERYPTAVASADASTVLMTWNVGPMAVQGNSLVKWACYAAGNGTVLSSGTVGTSTAGTKPTALLAGGGKFVLLTTAK